MRVEGGEGEMSGQEGRQSCFLFIYPSLFLDQCFI